MKPEFKFEHVQEIIDSPAVPGGNEGLAFFIDEAEVVITRAYQEQGKTNGNSIAIYREDGLTFFISLQKENGYEFVVDLYRESDADTFKTFSKDTPDHISGSLGIAWQQLLRRVQQLESEVVSPEFRVAPSLFAAQFAPHRPPEALLRWFVFEVEAGAGFFSDGFYFDIIDKLGLETYSTDPAFTHSFIEFAKANASGSTYAYWLVADKLEHCPIAVLGDEGGIHIIAGTLRELMQLLTLDVEITVGWEEAYFYKDEDYYEESPLHHRFVFWLENNFSIRPLTRNEEADRIIKEAKELYQPAFHAFLDRFGIEY